MSMTGFPLLLIPLAICNIIAFLMPGVSFTATLVTFPMTSGADWTVTLSDAIITLGLLTLALEIARAARGKHFIDHFLACLIVAAAVGEFVLLPQFANSTFFVLTLISLVDFLAGITLRRRRVVMVAARETAPAPIEPRIIASIIPPVEPVDVPPAKQLQVAPESTIARLWRKTQRIAPKGAPLDNEVIVPPLPPVVDDPQPPAVVVSLDEVRPSEDGTSNDLVTPAVEPILPEPSPDVAPVEPAPDSDITRTVAKSDDLAPEKPTHPNESAIVDPPPADVTVPLSETASSAEVHPVILDDAPMVQFPVPDHEPQKPVRFGTVPNGPDPGWAPDDQKPKPTIRRKPRS